MQTVVQARFQAAGIPVLTRYPEGGGLGKVYLGFSGYGVDLYVPKSRESEAPGPVAARRIAAISAAESFI